MSVLAKWVDTLGVLEPALPLPPPVYSLTDMLILSLLRGSFLMAETERSAETNPR